MPDSAASPIIADRGEFVDVLRALRRGCVLVRARESGERCLLDGSVVSRSYEPLSQFGLISEYDNPKGFPELCYYRLNERGSAFAERVFQAWGRRPLLERLAVRLVG